MSIGERILLSLSRAPEDNDYLQKESDANMTVDNALGLLTRVLPDLSTLVSGKRVVDFGCGVGYQSIALVKKFGCSVFGIDSNNNRLEVAIGNAKKHGVSARELTFVESISPEMRNTFDVVISQNSFEHFSNPREVLNEMRSLLSDSGMIVITFGPPWFAPHGSHMHFFCNTPWINVVFSEKTVMRARSHFRNDGAKRYEEVESGLNKMTIAKFESIVASCNLSVKYKNYQCIKGIDWLSKIPLLRELFINHVTAVLSK